MTNEIIEAEGFVLYPCTGPIPERKPPEPAPQPWKQPSDEVISSNAERCWSYSAARPVVRNGKHTGEWQVSVVNPRNCFNRRWIVKPNQDEADDWCRRVEAYMSKKI